GGVAPPRASELLGEALRLGVPRPGEREDRPPLEPRDLRHEPRGVPEPVEAEPRDVAREPYRAGARPAPRGPVARGGRSRPPTGTARPRRVRTPAGPRDRTARRSPSAPRRRRPGR